MAHEFTACEIFGTRYSSLGKRIETSLPHGEADNARTLISDLNIFQLCGLLDLELEDEEAELDYLIENRKQYYKNHSYMEKKAIGKANDGPVFVGDKVLRILGTSQAAKKLFLEEQLQALLIADAGSLGFVF